MTFHGKGLLIKLQCSRDLCSFMVDGHLKHGAQSLGFNALDLSPMTSANRESIISNASGVESLDKAHVPPVTSLFWRVTARSLLQSARARARAGTARLRRKKRNCWLATKEKSEQAINYVSAIVASMLVFSLALVPTLVAIVSWKATVGLVKKSRRT